MSLAVRGLSVREGVLPAGLPFLRAGSGPPVVVLPGIAAEHRNPSGFARWRELQALASMSERLEVWRILPRPGLMAGTSIADLADDLAGALRCQFGGPVPVVGISTGGVIAQQLAIDHPDVVERLVLVATACRLSAAGRQAQRRLAQLTADGRHRAAWSTQGPVLAATRIGARALSVLLWLMGPLQAPDDPSDLLAVIAAEEACDLTPQLHLIAVPSLVVGGGRDMPYGPELMRVTARGIPGARQLLYPGKGHLTVMAHPPARHEITRFLAGESEPVLTSIADHPRPDRTGAAAEQRVLDHHRGPTDHEG